MKVVITDHRFPDIDTERRLVEHAGFHLEVHQCRTAQDVLRSARDADAILVVRAPITRDVIEQLDRCRVIVRYGIGVDTIDVSAATERNIMVANVPDYCVDEVSTHALALLLTAARRLPAAMAVARSSRWGLAAVPQMHRLDGTTLGLIGVGRIGSALARKARGLGIRSLAVDPYFAAASAATLGVELVQLGRLLAEADFVSLHAPLTPETHHILNADALRRMKRSAIVVNTARGGLIDEPALIRALIAGEIGGAALDVTENEPPGWSDDVWLSTPNLIVTPHVAWYSEESIRELQTKAAQQVVTALQGGAPYGLVNGVPPK